MKTTTAPTHHASLASGSSYPPAASTTKISRRRTSLSPSSERNPLTEYYQAQRNPYAQKSPVIRPTTTAYTKNPLQLQLAVQRQKQALRGRQVPKGTRVSSNSRRSSRSFVSMVLALFKWFWPRRQTRSAVVKVD